MPHEMQIILNVTVKLSDSNNPKEELTDKDYENFEKWLKRVALSKEYHQMNDTSIKIVDLDLEW